MSESNFSGARVFITGASSGIGEEFARQLHAQGAEIMMVARREERLAALADSFNRIRHGSAAYQTADLSELAESPAQSHFLEKYFKENRVDILINNAGFGSFGRFEELSLESEVRMVSVNAASTIRLAHAAIPQMKARKSGAIISVSSVAGMQPIPYMATYSATKAFNFFHSVALREELKPFGIKVLTVCPGPVATEFRGIARVPGTMGDMRRNEVGAVVRESLGALRRGKAWIVPCLQAKLMAGVVNVLPKWLTTQVVERQLRKIVERGHTS